MQFNVKKVAMGIAFLASAGAALAETANLSVSATVQTVCAISDGTLPFGNISPVINGDATVATPANVDLDSGATVEVACTNGATGTITADSGLNADGALRRMRLGVTTDYLPYELYTSAARSTVLNDTNAISYTGKGSTESVTVYGRILGTDLQSAKVGSYSDNVALTITYAP
jgi:spore coat protein U-like protein